MIDTVRSATNHFRHPPKRALEPCIWRFLGSPCVIATFRCGKQVWPARRSSGWALLDDGVELVGLDAPKHLSPSARPGDLHPVDHRLVPQTKMQHPRRLRQVAA